MEYQWSEISRGSVKYSEKNLAILSTTISCGLPCIAPGPQRWEDGYRLPELWHIYTHFTQEELKIRMNDVNVKLRTGSVCVCVNAHAHVCV